MNITIFSFLMSIIFFNFYIIVINFFRKKDNFIVNFKILPLLWLCILSIFRLVFPLDFNKAIIVHSNIVLSKLYKFIAKPINIASFNMNLLTIVVIIWISVFIILFIIMIYNYIKIKLNLDKITKYENKAYNHLFESLLDKKKKKRPSLVISPNICSPMIVGFIKPIIYVPNIELTEEQATYILKHEIAHYENRDVYKKIFISFLKILFWWNPFIHLFSKNFGQILEIQCDLNVVENFSNKQKLDYLKTMVYIAEISLGNQNNIFNRDAGLNLLGNSTLNFASQRFNIVLDEKKTSNKIKRINIIICFFSLLLFLLSYFIILQPRYDAPADSYSTVDEQNGNMFLTENSDGSYNLYRNNVFLRKINVEEKNLSFNNLSVYSIDQ